MIYCLFLDLFEKDGVEYLAEKLLFNWQTVLENLNVPQNIIDYYRTRHLNNIWLQAREALNWWIANRQLNFERRLQQLFEALRRSRLNDVIPDIENTYGVKGKHDSFVKIFLMTVRMQMAPKFKKGEIHVLLRFRSTNIGLCK